MLLLILLLSLILLNASFSKDAVLENLDDKKDLVPFPNLFIIGAQKV